MALRPNILIISAVCLRADRLSCYGYPRDTSPNIARLAAEGTLFERAYTTAGWTPPAHASLLTGLYPSRHGVVGDAALSPTLPTMPKLLGKLGYHTVGIVQQSLIGTYAQMAHGFNEFHELQIAARARRLGVGIREHASRRTGGVPALRSLLRLGRLYRRAESARATTRRAIAWLDAHGQERQPFFMFMEYFNVHEYFWGPARALLRDRAADLYEQRIFDPRHRATLEARYDAEVRRLDSHLGRVLRQMRRQGTLDRTLVILLSPHGENLGEHGLVGHQASLHEPIVHVPLVVRHPEIAPSGLRVRSLAQLTDLLPTVLELAGGDGAGTGLQGSSLLPMEADRVYRDYAVAEWEGRASPVLRRSPSTPAQRREIERRMRIQRMIVQASHKYIRASDGEEELFDLAADPDEAHNLVAQQPGHARAMSARLDAWLGSFSHRPATPLPEPPEAVLHDLRRSGYRL